MSTLPSEAEPVVVRIVPDPDGVPVRIVPDSGGILTVQIKKKPRWRRIVAQLVLVVLIIFGFAFASKLYDQRPSTYMIAHALDAANAANLPLSSMEVHAMTGYQAVPAYPPPAKGRESDRVAADAALITVDAAASQDNFTLVVGVGFALVIALVILFLSIVFAS